MKSATLLLAVFIGVVLSPGRAFAPAPTPCHLRLTGRFVSPTYSYDQYVKVKLKIHGNGEDPPILTGRMRCNRRWTVDCFLADAAFDVSLETHGDGNHIGFKTPAFTMPRTDRLGGVCELQGVTGDIRRNLCFGALIGTFTCAPESIIPMSGNFGWTVDTCKCLRP